MARTRLPWWLQVTVLFAIGRVITTAMMVVILQQQGAPSIADALAGLPDFSSNWDGRWYNVIAAQGYPGALPIGANGHVAENAWAFLPAYPALVKLLMLLTGLSWAVVAESLSLLFALGASMLLYRMLVRAVPAQQAIFAVCLFQVAMVSPLFQIAYAEAMQLFLIALAVVLMQRRQYGWVIPVVLVLAFTRPGALAIAAALGLLWLYRFVNRSRSRFPRAERWQLALAALVAGVSGVAWMLIAAVVTGVPSAYLDTELAWRAAYIGYTELLPFTPWIQSAEWWTFSYGNPTWWGYAALAVLVAGFAIFLFIPPMKKLGVVIRFYLASYALYVLAVFFPQSSTFRILAPLFPALGVIAAPRSRVYRVVAVVLSLALQWWWLNTCWKVDGYDWTPP
jgi:hypothetical protein